MAKLLQSEGSAPSDRVSAQPPEDFRLKRIGVLELVDQHSLVAHGQRPSDGVVVSQQSECGVDEIVEVEHSGRALLSLEPLDGGAQFLDEAPSASAPIAPASAFHASQHRT